MEPRNPPRQPRRLPKPLAEEAVRWGFRMLAGREPISDKELQTFQALPDMNGLRRTLANTHDFHAFFGALFTPHQAWTMPLFLARPSEVPGVEWRFTPPSLDQPTCQMATTAQFAEPAFLEIAAAMGVRPGKLRSLWQQAWVIAILAEAGVIGPGRRALAIDAERERIASVLAARSVEVVATSAEALDATAAERRRLLVFHPEAVTIEAFDQFVAHGQLDPRQLGAMQPGQYDACWSIGLPDRLGSVAAALDAFEASLVPLKPGGIAAHVVNLNLVSNGLTWDQPDNVLMRRADIEALAARLLNAGHRLLPLNTHPGADLADEQVQNDLGATIGLRQRRGMMVHTAFGLAIRKAG